MFRRTIGVGFVGLVALGVACGDDEENEPATDQLIEALGGQPALDDIEGLRIEGTGSRFMPNEGRTPDQEAIEAHTFERTVSTWPARTISGCTLGNGRARM